MALLDTADLEVKVKDLYRRVAEEPHGAYHFQMGRALAERLGYPPDVLDRIPGEAIESFAGVGYFFDLARIQEGDQVVDLGSGSGMDAFVAAVFAGPAGRVLGIDFTPEQLAKARRLAATDHDGVKFREGWIERVPLGDESVDCVISNGVINLSPHKQQVFAEVARILRPGGRLALADIVSERQLTETIVCSADLWASCIGGAAQQDTYRATIAAAGLQVVAMRTNPYEFVSEQARNAGTRFGVRSVSLLAVKT